MSLSAELRTRIVTHWLPPIAWMVAIFVLSSMPATTVESVSREVRSGASSSLVGAILTHQATAHTIEFGVLAVLFYRIAAMRRGKPDPLAWSLPLVVAFAYALSDELHQAFVPGRVASASDLGYDFLGATAGLAVAEATAQLRRRMSNRA